MRHIDLFSGIGGFALSASRVWPDLDIVTFCEKNTFCQKVLKKHWPNTPICEDIYDFDGRNYKDIDILTAGYPCQPFSTASRGRIVADDMSGFAIQAVHESLPRIVVFENVQEHTIKHCAEQLEFIGYSAVSIRISSYEIGSPHRRNRWWCAAHSNNKSQFSSQIHAEMALLQDVEDTTWKAKNYARTFRVHDGIPHRMDRLKSLGNAIVPQVAGKLFRAIKKIDERSKLCI